MTCLYCKQERQATGVEHVYPDALGHHNWMLPLSAVCDTCNGGVLRRLDEALVEHPHISMALFLWRIPGKSGAFRKQHGFLRWEADGGIRIEVPRSKVIETTGTTGELKVRAATPSRFRDDRFRRALYKVALNFVAATDGVERALQPQYDQVRRYVVQPGSSKTKLPYVRRRLFSGDLMQVTELNPVSFSRARCDGVDSVGMSLLTDEFFVDLLEPDRVEALVKHTKANDDKARYAFFPSSGPGRAWDGGDLPAMAAREGR